TTPQPFSDSPEVRQILSRISFLGGIEEDSLEKMLGYFERAHFKKGECIASKGEEPTRIYIIQSGRVTLRITAGSLNLLKRSFEVGDHFGEVAMLSMVNNTASFFASDDCQLITFSRKSLARLSREEPLIFRQLILNLARDLARKVQYSDELMLRSGEA
ncbi:MAG: cyclic nucleotide-binding domain-containing protein, partial [Opitutales bacterium]|nr:cyclic nucleotide-binding domain-containing protein [Opitutales bacterium]